ncbi:glycosyltransferase family 2 protein [Aggregatibacter actinomycetemcomitans]|uniref:glycosyltransferase family 2 protein n=1 Tax=Aggregatibacter actinomycetemcomitans TaxID=714 RepID=UPI000240020C|nr:glycosyltransferase family 2 protein [Aggregatibacter actinomycetemcomitans]EHK89648.1 group 2 glycosyl transferase [Aggregatibacter actinomycetemcomitans RhAA1]KNE76749.1 glycosyl transferase [Aggregatibacter actinomycetemcomitans RhAA1]MBN6071049.1 glycosyltransferase family 2 protein [Aggregatibacter actinomycetemcomitans]MBN6078829.1 glycosyltransferase family 2 protein [Aggregatibacter actinomycetemcomitans]
MKILLIIPCYNESESIISLLDELKDYPEYDYIVINDCSKDNTSKIARNYGANVIDLPINLGLSGCVQTGMMYATKNDYDICIQIDGDGQHMPSEIYKLVDKIKDGVDIAISSRFLESKGSYSQTFLRTLGAKHIQFCIKLFSGLTLTDPTSGMRAFTKNVFQQMAYATNERPEPDTMLYFARLGYRIEEVQVTMRERFAGESYLTPIKAAKYMIENTVSFLFVVFKTLGKRGKK